eukprot:GHVU01178352.1.p1 GENE.GHVU01178352.1~~GHVU01178352.1.p1  ORF type:complete len:160 (+),score=9.61 GHVU01178352.1:308-787(+)
MSHFYPRKKHHPDRPFFGYNEAVLRYVLVAAAEDHESQLVKSIGSSVNNLKSSVYIRLELQNKAESNWTRLVSGGHRKFKGVVLSKDNPTQVVIARNEGVWAAQRGMWARGRFRGDLSIDNEQPLRCCLSSAAAAVCVCVCAYLHQCGCPDSSKSVYPV